MRPKVSIAMATYNGSSWISQQLESFALQETRPDEVIIVDDCSTDDTCKKIRIFASTSGLDIHLYVNAQNAGCTPTFLKAISLCEGDVIFLSDQDDIWYPKKISTLLSSIDRDRGIHVVTGDAVYTDAENNSYNLTVLKKVMMVSDDQNSHISGACTAVTQEFCSFVMPHAIENLPQHDVYLHRWANLLGAKRVVPEVLQTWRLHDENASSSEMKEPSKLSRAQLFWKYLDVDARASWISTMNEFEAMRQHLDLKRDKLGLLNVCDERVIRKKLHVHICALRNRAQLYELPFFLRLAQVVKMLIQGDYRNALGWNSLIKDILLIVLRSNARNST
jgi:glycosyltransferase involved in cell wall biosynthesis